YANGQGGEPALINPDELSNQILWLRETNTNTGGEIDNWTNKFNGGLDAVKITDGRRPALNATAINNLPAIAFTRANNDTLQTEAGLGLTGDFTAYVIFKCTDPTIAGSQFLIQNIDTGAGYVNTGIQLT